MTDAAPGSVTDWIQLAKGTQSKEAQQRLFQRFFSRVKDLASAKLACLPDRRADPEQVALDVLASFFQGVKEKRFPDLSDRDDLWQILLDLTDKKSIDEKRYEGAHKRDWRRTQGESTLDPTGQVDAAKAGAANLPDWEPTPEYVVECAEQALRLLELLDREDESGRLRRVAEAKLNGYTNKSIAERQGLSLRSLERKLSTIRRLWTSALAE